MLQHLSNFFFVCLPIKFLLAKNWGTILCRWCQMLGFEIYLQFFFSFKFFHEYQMILVDTIVFIFPFFNEDDRDKLDEKS